MVITRRLRTWLGVGMLAGAMLLSGCKGVPVASSDSASASEHSNRAPSSEATSSEAGTQDHVAQLLLLVGKIGSDDRVECEVPYHDRISVKDTTSAGTAFHDPWAGVASYVTDGYQAYESGDASPAVRTTREIMVSRADDPQHRALDIVAFPPDTGFSDALAYLQDHVWTSGAFVKELSYHTPASIPAIYMVQREGSPFGSRLISVFLEHKGRLYNLNIPVNPDPVVETVLASWKWTSEDPLICPTRPEMTTLPYMPFGSYATFAPFRLLAPKDLPFSTYIPAELPGLPDGFAVRNVQVGSAKGVIFGDLQHDREVTEVLFMPSGSPLKSAEAVLQAAIKPYTGEPYRLRFVRVVDPDGFPVWMIRDYNGIDPKGSIRAEASLGKHGERYFIYIRYGWYEADLFPTLDEWRWDDGKSFE